MDIDQKEVLEKYLRPCGKRLKAEAPHVPEPWHVENHENCSHSISIWDSTGNAPFVKCVAGDWGDDFPSMRFVDGDSPDTLSPKIETFMNQITYGHIPIELARANARRIVACVNACAGIPTDVLERGRVIRKKKG